MRALLGIAAALLYLVLPAGSVAQGAEPFTLDTVRAQVVRDYPAVRQLSPLALARTLKEGGDVLLIDVREPEEFAVSRIPGAERVDPGIWRHSFLKRFADRAKGLTVVFYCAVGVRSSRLATRVQEALKRHGAVQVFNLDGGVFAWHSEDRPLVDARGPTRFVHRFDSHWGRLVARPDEARDHPRQ